MAEKDPKADETEGSKYSSALKKSLDKIEAELKIYNSLLSKHHQVRKQSNSQLVLVSEKREGP